MQATVWLEFVVAGGLLTCLLWVLQRRTWKLSNRLLVALVPASVGLVWAYIEIGPRTLGEGAWYNLSPWRELVSFVLMLAGMVARYFTQAIEVRRAKLDDLIKKGQPFVKPGLEFDVWEFAYPFFISVITYGALIAQMNDAKLSIATVTLCFQFGFFWQTVLGAKQKVVS